MHAIYSSTGLHCTNSSNSGAGEIESGLRVQTMPDGVDLMELPKIFVMQ